MSKQIDIFEKSKKDWNEEFSKSKSRDKSFDTLSGMSQEPLYYPSEPDNDTATATSSSVVAVTLEVIGESSTELTVIVTVEVLLSSSPSLTL